MVCPVCGEKDAASLCERCGTDLAALLGDGREARLQVVRVGRPSEAPRA